MEMRGRVKEILENAVGKSNKERTRYFVEQARIFSEKHPDTNFTEFKVPFSNQRGYALVIPPENKTDDSEYILLSAHLDAAQGPETIFRMYKPGANDNGFASAFLQTYSENLGEERGEKGLIMAGFPHEEGSEVYRTIGLLGLSIVAGVGFSKALGSHINQTTSYMLGFFGALQLYDVVGSPLKLGLIGSSTSFKNVLQEELDMDLEKIVYAVNLDMIGSAGKTTEVSIPYESPTMNPTSWLLPKKMDKSFIADMECMLLFSAVELDNEKSIENLLINHQLLLGSSDHAELSKYIKKTSAIIHGNNWADIHKKSDEISKLSFLNVEWYNHFIQLLTSSLDEPWKEESQIEILEDRGFISEDIDKVSIYELGEEIVCLLRRTGDNEKNPLNILYSVEDTLEGYVAKEFVTYGLQDNPRELLKHPDLNLENWLDGRKNNFEKRNLEDTVTLSMNGEEYSILPNKKTISDYGVEISSKVLSFLGERSSAALTIGVVALGMVLYDQIGGRGGPADVIIGSVARIKHQLYYAQGLKNSMTEVGNIALSIGAAAIGSAAITGGLMKVVPPIKRKMRNLNVAAGNRSLDYHVIE